jgi:DNA-binding transcriptional MerR regulator
MHYTIGEFSKMTALTVKSLRLYHEKELLVPSEIDDFTNYRYYDDANFETARVISILKRYDFSLAEIRQILDECQEEEDALLFFEKKLGEIEEKIQHYSKVSRDIELSIKFERERLMNSENSFDIEEKVVDSLLIAGHRMKGQYQDYGEGIKVVAKQCGRHINGKAMCLYHDGEYKENDADFEPFFPVRKGTSSSEVSVRELAGGRCVSLIHKGPYDTLSESYKAIYSYIKEKGYSTILPTREVYIKGPGMIFRGNPNNYLTEIQMFLSD